MAFNGTEGSPIDPQKAGEWTRNYREANPGKTTAYFAGREILEQLLAQPGCMGVRLYYGLDSGVPHLVAVGADSEENDQLGENFIVADELSSCPSCCSQPNILNS